MVVQMYKICEFFFSYSIYDKISRRKDRELSMMMILLFFYPFQTLIYVQCIFLTKNSLLEMSRLFFFCPLEKNKKRGI